MDGLVALVMSIAAGISAEENRWVEFDEVAKMVNCDPEGDRPHPLATSQDLGAVCNQMQTGTLEKKREKNLK